MTWGTLLIEQHL